MNNTFKEVKLTDVQIRQGNLDIDSMFSDFFPNGCFGDRTRTNKGNEIILNYGINTIQTDIRIKSSKVISPRKRFGSWFQKSLKAKPGDIIVINKKSTREYSLIFKKRL